MGDLIDREEAIKVLISNFDDAAEAFIRLEKLPAVNAVPVVRCKNCKWWSRIDYVYNIAYGDCTNPHAIIRETAIPSERYFCPDGERRDGGNE